MTGKGNRTAPTVGPEAGEPREAELSASEIKARATTGAALLAGRGLLLQLAAFGANIVLARLLTPKDFGTVALGMTLVALGTSLADGGLGAALVREARPPERDDLRALSGLQLVVSGVFAVAIAASALLVGAKAGAVAAIMACALPILALKAPGAITLERSLRYKRFVTVELVETGLYYAWSIAFVSLGWGVWALATGVVVQAIAGLVTMSVASGLGFVPPKFSWKRVKRLLRFGAQFQGLNLVYLIHDQSLRLGIGAIAGLSVLGLWSLAFRVVQSANILFNSLWRVSYPAMARLMNTGADARPLIERGVGVVAVFSGAVLTPIVGAGAGLVPTIFGARWAEASNMLPGACLGLMIGGPVSVATAGYLLAAGEAGVILRSGIRHTVADLAVSFGFLHVGRLWALGAGSLAAQLVESVVLGRAASKRTGARIVSPLLAPLTAAVVVASAGWIATGVLDASAQETIIAAAGSEVLYLLLLGLLSPSSLVDAARLVRRSVGGFA